MKDDNNSNSLIPNWSYVGHDFLYLEKNMSKVTIFVCIADILQIK